MLAVAAIAAGLTPCQSQQTRLLTADKHNEYGLVYTLPRTMLRVEVDVECVERKAGPFYQYAKKYIGTDNVVKSDGRVWTVKGVRVTPIGVGDTERRYLMQLKNNSPVTMSVGDNDMLAAINYGEVSLETYVEEEAGLEIVREGTDVEEFLQYMGEDYLASTSTAKRAQQLSEQLVEIRDSRNALTRGTADNMPSDGRQLELMLDNMQKQERAMTAAFSGSEKVMRQTVTYYYEPDEEGSEVLFRMSDFAGPVDKDNYAGSPVEISVKILEEGKLPVDAKGEEKKLPKDAVMYCIPGRASINITHDGKKLYSSPNVYIAQYGMDFGLDPSIFTDKKDPAYVLFDTATGGVLEKGSVKDLSKASATRVSEPEAQSAESGDSEEYSTSAFE